MTTETFARIPLAHIVTSLTNPRKHFDPANMAELEASVRASGVHQPVLVRPLPGSRLDETAHLDPRPQWELVSGERRLRASIAAELDSIPAMVRALTDAQALEIQIVENLQRADLEPLDEAEGYHHLMTHHQPPLNAQAVGDRIGKSRSYVYARLKLLDLCLEGREALRAGHIEPTVALLLARIPDTKRQAEALEEVRADPSAFDPRPMGAREAAKLLQRDYMLKLANARFPVDCAALLPSAGSCTTCPKRTGADPDLFADVNSPDVCTHPPCFHQKEQAHTEAQMAQAVARGQTVIAGREAQELIASQWDSRVEGYLRLDNAADSPEDAPLRALIGQQMEAAGVQPVLIANPHREGELIAVLPRETVSELLLAKGYEAQAAKLSAAGDRQAELEAAQDQQARQTAYEQGWRWSLLQSIHSDGQASPAAELPASVARLLCEQYVGMLNQERAKPLAKLLDLGKVAPKECLTTLARETPAPLDLLLLLVAHKDVEYQPWLEQHQPNAPRNVGLLRVAQALQIDAEAIKTAHKAQTAAELRAETKARKAREAEQAQQAAQSDPSAGVAPSSGGRGEPKPGASAKPRKPKLTPQQALSSIAAELQSEATQATEHAEAPKPETTPDGCAVGEPSRATPPDAGAAEPAQGEPDELVSEARRIVVANQKASISYLQRVLKINYNRAARLLDTLEAMGVVGPHHPDRGRHVLELPPHGVEPVDHDENPPPSDPTLWVAGAAVMVTGHAFHGRRGFLVRPRLTAAGDEWMVQLNGLASEYRFAESELALVDPDEQPDGLVMGEQA